MATFNTYFAQVLRIEEELKLGLLGNLPGAMSVSELILDANGVGGALVELVVNYATPSYFEIAQVGISFARSINGADVIDRSGPAVAEGLRRLRQSATATVSKFLIEFDLQTNRMLDAGTSTEQVRAVLEAGLTPMRFSPLFSSLINGLVRDVANNVQFVADEARLQTLVATPGQPNVDDFAWMWITVHDSRVCPDCEPRHGKVHTLEEWALLGEPRSGWSICGPNCRCALMPDKYVDDEIDLRTPVTINREAVLATITRRQ